MTVQKSQFSILIFANNANENIRRICTRRLIFVSGTIFLTKSKNANHAKPGRIIRHFSEHRILRTSIWQNSAIATHLAAQTTSRTI